MKKHPVDDLFKSKFSDWEKQPSSLAWSRIAKEQKTGKRKVATWVWYAAASIMVATLAGYLVWQEGSSQYLSVEKNIAGTERKIDTALPVSPSTDETKKSVKETKKHEEIMPVVIDRAVADHSKTKREHQTVIKQREPDLHIESEMKDQEIVEIAVEGIKRKDGSSEKLKTTISPEFLKEIKPQTALASKETGMKEENRTIVVNVEIPEKDLPENSKTSRFTKVFRQLKNARAGDPVDWKEVGFNPKDIVAKVDERIRDKEGEISEKYQNIKQRTKL